MHGGGMILGNRFTFGDALDWVKELRAILVSVEYRMPPEHPHPAPVEDCYAGLKWISEHASELGINEVRIMTVGPFGGGCVAAGLALLARDRGGPRIHAQCLPYPMLDDRMENVSSKQYFNIGKWQGGINEPAWNFLLDGKRGAEDVSIYAAPARATDLSRLPPTWLDVGAAELFRDEVVAYASKLWEGGVQAELHVWPGCWHAFDAYAPDSALSRLSRETRMKWMKRVL
ncbi:putative alpha/beta hydrolase protein, partial [Mollisia scopiformis]